MSFLAPDISSEYFKTGDFDVLPTPSGPSGAHSPGGKGKVGQQLLLTTPRLALATREVGEMAVKQ